MFCPKCGTKNPDGAKFCSGCGGPLAAPAQNNASQPAQSGAAPQGSPQPASVQSAPGLGSAAVGAGVNNAANAVANLAGKNISRRNLIIGAGVGIVALGGAIFGLTRCAGGAFGGGGKIPANGNDYTLFSAALSNGRTIWYNCSDDYPDRTSSITRAYVFEGGKVTRYELLKYEGGDTSDSNNRSQPTFEDLNELSDDDIVAKLAEWDQQNFNYHKQEFLDKFTFTNRYDENGNELSEHQNADFATAFDNNLAHFNKLCSDSGLSSEFATFAQGFAELGATAKDFASKQLDIVNAVEYQAPQAQDYKLAVVADGTGNYAEKEGFAYLYNSVDFTDLTNSSEGHAGALRNNLSDLLNYFSGDSYFEGYQKASDTWKSSYFDRLKQKTSSTLEQVKYYVSKCSNVDIAYQTSTWSCTISKSVNSYATIYDKNYGGFTGFVCLMDEKALGVTFDTPSSSAVEVVDDIKDIDLTA